MMHKSINLSNPHVKLISLWTAPRCVSTAFEKAFSQHPNTVTIHEPFLNVYYYSQWRRSDRLGDYAERLNYDTEQVIDHIQSQCQPIIFMKEMAYQALPYIETQFLNPPLVNTFLVRNPKKSLLSWYKLNEFPNEEELGFIALQEMWNLVIEEQKQPPILVEADRLQSDPQQTFHAYCKAVGIEFSPRMLSWSEGRMQREDERDAEIHQKWHQTLGCSKGINPPTEASGEIRPEDLPMLERAMAVYDTLSQYTLN
ncbi:MAG: sulfotransferase family protein [Cyanobacteria bacterium P01_F01_bin.150]